MPKRSLKSYKKAEAIPEFEIGSGNVFADIGVSDPGAALAKAEVATQIAAAIRRKKLTQTEAANVLGIDQPRVSYLLRGRLSLFSLERLMMYAAKLGNAVEVRIVPAGRPGIRIAKAFGCVSVYARFNAISPLSATDNKTSLPDAWFASKVTEERLEVYEG